jgi:cytochrome c oxidase subunit 2
MLSALESAGRDADRILQLTIWLSAGAVAIWLGMVVLALAITRIRALATPRGGTLLIVGGGVVFPVLVLTSLLVFGVSELPHILAAPPDERLRVEVTGNQWWWRVRYVTADGRAPVETANEVRLPVGQRVEARLRSADVVHSFWIPALAGKMDMIPGRVTRLPLEPTRTGTFRGACAEFCGLSHARMHLTAVTLAPTDFEAWLDAQRQPAAAPVTEPARRGHAAFFAQGCGACHTVRGTTAVGWIGPDLTHLASRPTIAGAMLPNSAEARRQWISRTHLMKPGAHMPAFAHLPEQTLDDLTAYLGELR